MYDSVVLKADSLIFGSRKLGTFCNGGVLDSTYWWRNSEHFLHVKELISSWFRSVLRGSVSEVKFKTLTYDFEWHQYIFYFEVVGASGDAFVSRVYVKRV